MKGDQSWLDMEPVIIDDFQYNLWEGAKFCWLKERNLSKNAPGEGGWDGNNLSCPGLFFFNCFIYYSDRNLQKIENNIQHHVQNLSDQKNHRHDI